MKNVKTNRDPLLAAVGSSKFTEEIHDIMDMFVRQQVYNNLTLDTNKQTKMLLQNGFEPSILLLLLIFVI